MNVIAKYFYTIKDLKLIQIIARIRNLFFKTRFKDIAGHAHLRPIRFSPPSLKTNFLEKKILSGTEICFLNKKLSIDDFFKPEKYKNFLPLEQFTLHYLDFIGDGANATSPSKFAEFYENHPDLPFAFESYVISCRLINFLKISTRISLDNFTLKHISRLGTYLEKNREFHLLGNHLLKNIKALIFYKVYFNEGSEKLNYELKLLEDQLNEQILPDGWHFERTPAYHLIVLEDLMDIWNIMQGFKWIEEKIRKMLEVISFWEDEYPLFNDSSYRLAPSLKEIINYAEKLNFNVGDAMPVPAKAGMRPVPNFVQFPHAGYFAYFKPSYKLWIDAGDLGPSYLPAHAHNDSLSFILYIDGKSVITDTGACSYQDYDLRNIARSVKSHNTVMIDDIEPSFFWKNFRYARKIKLISREVKEDCLKAKVSYCNKTHERKWKIGDNFIKIYDVVKGDKATAFLHFGIGYKVSLENNNRTAIIKNENKKIAEINSESNFTIRESLFCPNINDIYNRMMLSIPFCNTNIIEIRIL